jgi:hypothetical protein
LHVRPHWMPHNWKDARRPLPKVSHPDARPTTHLATQSVARSPNSSTLYSVPHTGPQCLGFSQIRARHVQGGCSGKPATDNWQLLHQQKGTHTHPSKPNTGSPHQQRQYLCGKHKSSKICCDAELRLNARVCCKHMSHCGWQPPAIPHHHCCDSWSDLPTALQLE